MQNKLSGFAYYFLVVALILTPNLPMPASAQGPIAPMLYLMVFGVFIFFLRERFNETIKNRYVGILLVLQFTLLLSDFLRILLFDVRSEIYYPPIRIVNACIFILGIYYFVEKQPEHKSYGLNKTMMRVYIGSIFLACLILYGQTFGFIQFGMINQARTFFGIKLPFNKPVGIFDLSDGKLGIMIAPLFFFYVVNAFKKTRFHKLKYHIPIIFMLGLLILFLQSRSGYLALVVAGFVFLLIQPVKITKVFLTVGGALFVLLGVFTNIFSFIWSGLSGEGIYEKNVEGRGEGLVNAVNKFLESPILGVGHKDAIRVEGILDDGHIAHNLFLDHLSSGGLIAALPLSLMFIAFFYIATKAYLAARKAKHFRIMGSTIWLTISMIYILIELSFYRGLYNEYVYYTLGFGVLLYLNYNLLLREKNSAHI
ncbi:MAG: O-antigen ligase family protein [Gilvibacter sp.]